MKAGKYASVDKRRCVACGECSFVCPRGAVAIVSGSYAEVAIEKCVGCGICVKNCPAGCIVLAERGGERDA